MPSGTQIRTHSLSEQARQPTLRCRHLTNKCTQNHRKTFGKQPERTAAKDLRAILPLPTVLQVLDGLVAKQLDSEISQAVQQAPEDLIGARRDVGRNVWTSCIFYSWWRKNAMTLGWTSQWDRWT